MCRLREWCGRTYIWVWVCVRCTVGATKRGDDSGKCAGLRLKSSSW